MEWIFTLSRIGAAASALWKIADRSTVLAFHGAMGAGKTTFIHALCDIKQVKDVVGSPTFSIINEYVFREEEQEKKIFHIDLYRVRNEEEARQAGVEDCLYSGHTCLLEWPENAPSLLPPGTLHLYMEVVDEQTRRLQIGKI